LERSKTDCEADDFHEEKFFENFLVWGEEVGREATGGM